MIVTPSPQIITQAADLLKQAELVALPTETVYGLAADASNELAVKKIFAAKGRPADHPLIVHIADKALLSDWAIDIPEEAHYLADAFWPGALTLILQRSYLAPDVVTGGQDTVGLRVPSHSVALNLLKVFGGGLAAPSANKFGRISPTTAQHVLEELGDSVSMILDGGACTIGLESTIVDLSLIHKGEKARVLRPGGVSLSALSQVLGYEPEVKQKAEVRASGLLESHYAPTTPAVLVKQVHLQKEEEKTIAVLSLTEAPNGFEGVWIQLPNTAEAYGKLLYSALRQLDSSGVHIIYIQQVPKGSEWLAVRDRLKRATASFEVKIEEA